MASVRSRPAGPPAVTGVFALFLGRVYGLKNGHPGKVYLLLVKYSPLSIGEANTDILAIAASKILT